MQSFYAAFVAIAECDAGKTVEVYQMASAIVLPCQTMSTGKCCFGRSLRDNRERLRVGCDFINYAVGILNRLTKLTRISDWKVTN